MAVPVPARGHGATGGWGEESTWGTEAARTNWMPLVSQLVRRVRTKQPMPHLGFLGQASNNHREHYNDEERVEGSTEVVMAYDDSTLLLLKHLLGAVATGAGPPYTHTFTLATPQPEGLTMEIIPGTSPGFDAAQQFTGCLISRGTITVRPGSPLLLATDWTGKTSAGLEAAGTPTYNTTRERIAQQHCGTIQLGGTTVVLKQMMIRIDRGLEPLREMGSLNPSRPVAGQLSVEVELLAAWQANSFHTKYFADTQGDLTATFTGTSNRAMVVTAHNALIMDLSEPVSAVGQIEQRILLKPFADSGGDQGLTLAITNANASAITN